MSTQVILPKLGFSAIEATVVEWLAANGAFVEVGIPLFVVESEKSTMEIDSPASGVLTIHIPAGETHAVGMVIGEIA